MSRRSRRAGIALALSLGLPLLGLKLISFTGTAPDRPSVVVALPGCPPSPNCVASTDPDEAHRVAPLKFEGDAAAAMSSLELILADLGGTPLHAAGGYRHYGFRSRWMGYVDDVELLMNEEAKQIDVRSASRSGYGDFGVNRRRVEQIRARFTGNNR